jgi:hypothetical protein
MQSIGTLTEIENAWLDEASRTLGSVIHAAGPAKRGDQGRKRD